MIVYGNAWIMVMIQAQGSPLYRKTRGDMLRSLGPLGGLGGKVNMHYFHAEQKETTKDFHSDEVPAVAINGSSFL